jgi:hypothetical protein
MSEILSEMSWQLMRLRVWLVAFLVQIESIGQLYRRLGPTTSITPMGMRNLMLKGSIWVELA